MRVLAVGDDFGLRVEERADPRPRPGQVVVAVERCGICGSDRHFLEAHALPPGAVPGHEVAGIVAATGSGAPLGLEGERVAVLPCPRCGECDACRRGDTQLCPGQRDTFLGLGRNDGGFAEHVAIDAAACFPVPRGTTAAQASFAEPLAVGLHAVRRATLTPDDRVLVLGAGPIGLAVTCSLAHDRIADVTVSDLNAERVSLAETLGARPAVEPRPIEAFDVVFECAGHPATPQLALRAVRSGGRIVLVGVIAGGQSVGLRSDMWTAKEADVRPSNTYRTEEFAEAVEIVASGAVDPILAATDVVPIEGGGASLAAMSSADPPVKTQIDPALPATGS